MATMFTQRAIRQIDVFGAPLANVIRDGTLSPLINQYSPDLRDLPGNLGHSPPTNHSASEEGVSCPRIAMRP